VCVAQDIVQSCWHACVDDDPDADGSDSNSSSSKTTSTVGSSSSSSTSSRSSSSSSSGGGGSKGRAFRAELIVSNPVTYGHVHCAEALGVPLHLLFPQVPCPICPAPYLGPLTPPISRIHAPSPRSLTSLPHLAPSPRDPAPPTQ